MERLTDVGGDELYVRYMRLCDSVNGTDIVTQLLARRRELTWRGALLPERHRAALISCRVLQLVPTAILSGCTRGP